MEQERSSRCFHSLAGASPQFCLTASSNTTTAHPNTHRPPHNVVLPEFTPEQRPHDKVHQGLQEDRCAGPGERLLLRQRQLQLQPAATALPAQFNDHHHLQTSASNNSYNSISTHKDIKTIVESTLGSGTALAQAVKLPKDENVNEWLAVHVVDFYNQINMLYGTITEFCSPATCPRMIATSEYEYLWQDSNLSKPVTVSAPKYVECLMQWIQSLFDDENVFPSKLGQPFPAQFQSLVKTIMKRLFRIYAHIYCHHFNEVMELGLNTLLNTSFKHFLLFADEFNLVSQKDYGPLQTLVMEMLTSDDAEKY